MKISRVFERRARFEVDLISRYLESADVQYSQENAEVEAESTSAVRSKFEGEYEYRMYMDHLAYEHQLLEDIREMSEQLAIIALYRVVELNMKQMLMWRYEPEEVDKLRSIDKIENRLQKDGINLKDITDFKTADETRLLNNAIKHKNKVTKELAKYRGWREGDELKNLRHAYNRLSPKIPKFLEALAEKTVPPDSK